MAIQFLCFSATEPAQKPETAIENASSPYDLVIPAGGICGFVAGDLVTITNPAPAKIAEITAAGKNPWPTPPATAPAQFAQLADYGVRYGSFARGADGRFSRESVIENGEPTVTTYSIGVSVGGNDQRATITTSTVAGIRQ